MTTTFRSLNQYNYRLWAAGTLVSNVGTWMQRVGQDWLVLTELTHRNATAVGIVMALQFGPQLLLMPITGFVADHVDRRKLLFVTQGIMGLLALGLGYLTVTHQVELWHAYVFALLLGCTAAFDAPVRQAFVADVVGEAELSNAVALNSASFNVARMIGPAVAGLLIARSGTGPVFLINGATFAAVLLALAMLRLNELAPRDESKQQRGRFSDGFHYVRQQPELKVALLMLLIIGTFALNFPIFISTMSVTAFHAGASHYGFLTAMMAIGSVTGALLTARRPRPRFQNLPVSAAVLGFSCGLAALAPNYYVFGALLIIVGLSAQTFTTSTNSLLQLSSEPRMRGRVIVLFLATAMGTTPIGSPILGWVADTLGPRWAMGIGSLAGFGAALAGWLYCRRQLVVQV